MVQGKIISASYSVGCEASDYGFSVSPYFTINVKLDGTEEPIPVVVRYRTMKATFNGSPLCPVDLKLPSGDSEYSVIIECIERVKDEISKIFQDSNAIVIKQDDGSYKLWFISRKRPYCKGCDAIPIFCG